MKKTIIVCMVMLMALAMAVPCFASGGKYPPLPTQSKYVVVEEYDGEIYAFAIDSYRIEGDYLWCAVGTTDYHYNNGVWELDMVSDYEYKIGKDHNILYDNTGFFGVDNVIAWEGITSYADFKDVIMKAGEQISVASVVQVLAWIVGASVGLTFMWWGARKLTRAVVTAWTKARVKA